MVSCDITGEITGLNWKYIFLPFTYPTTYQVEFWYFKVYVIGIRFQTELTKISMTKGWSDQQVNAQVDKDLNP